MENVNQNTAQYLKASERIMRASMSQLAKEIKRLQYKRTMSPDKYGRQLAQKKDLLKAISKQYDILNNELTKYLESGVKTEWEFANFKNDELVENYIAGEVSAKYMQKNTSALNEFLKSSPFRSKIYELTNDSRQLVLDYISTGITQGRSSLAIARDLNKINSNPYDVTVFDNDGNPTKLKRTSKFLRDYKAQPGQYKKPLSNLMRLVRTETNRAYKMSDFTRRQQLDFVVGIEVHLSDSHEIYDICDEMKGKYPKGFVFTNWHPQCLCYTTSVLKTKEEFRNDVEVSKNTVTDIPESAKDYVKNAKPYWKNADWYKENFNKNRTVKADIKKPV